MAADGDKVITDSDRLIALYASLAGSGNRLVPRHELLHCVLYTHRSLFDRPFFDCNAQYPILAKVDEINSSFTNTGLLGFITPSGKKPIHDACRLYYEERIKPHISEEDLGKIEAIVNDINSYTLPLFFKQPHTNP